VPRACPWVSTLIWWHEHLALEDLGDLYGVLSTVKEVLRATLEYRRLLYEVAFTTGLRANELRSLTVEHLYLQRGGLHLDACWTKNRKPGFQYLPSQLLSSLITFAESEAVIKLYKTFYSGRKSLLDDICKPLLYVPSAVSKKKLSHFIIPAKAGIQVF